VLRQIIVRLSATLSNFKLKRIAAALRSFLAAARLPISWGGGATARTHVERAEREPTCWYGAEPSARSKGRAQRWSGRGFRFNCLSLHPWAHTWRWKLSRV